MHSSFRYPPNDASSGISNFFVAGFVLVDESGPLLRYHGSLLSLQSNLRLFINLHIVGRNWEEMNGF